MIEGVSRKKILWLVTGAMLARCIFNYVPGHIVVSFPFADLMPDEHGNLVRPVIPLPYYIYYLGEYAAYLCAWAALRIAFPKLRFELKVLFFSELAALFDFIMRYGQDIVWMGFDFHSVQFLLFGLSIPVKYLLISYGGSRIKT